VAVAAGSYRSFGLKANGSIVGWGGQSTIPVPNTRFIVLAAGSDDNLAIRTGCPSDEYCHDGLACNGVELCIDNDCVDGERACDDAGGVGCGDLNATEFCEEGEDGAVCDWCRNVTIGDCDTSVPDQRLDDGRTMNRGVDDCEGRAGNHGRFVECVGALARGWRSQGLISGKEYGQILRCAGTSSILHRPEPERAGP
jgi:hypothetical protein